MYKSKYKPDPDHPLTITIPMLLEWKGMSPQRMDDLTEGRIKQANIHRICSAETKSPGREVVSEIASFFGLSFTQIWDVSFVEQFVQADGNKDFATNSALDAARQGVTDSNSHSKIPSATTSVSVKYGSEPLDRFARLTESERVTLIKEFVLKLGPLARVEVARAALADLQLDDQP